MITNCATYDSNRQSLMRVFTSFKGLLDTDCDFLMIEGKNEPQVSAHHWPQVLSRAPDKKIITKFSAGLI